MFNTVCINDQFYNEDKPSVCWNNESLRSLRKQYKGINHARGLEGFSKHVFGKRGRGKQSKEERERK